MTVVPSMMPSAFLGTHSWYSGWVRIQNRSVRMASTTSSATCSTVRADGGGWRCVMVSNLSPSGAPSGRFRSLSPMRVGTTPGHSTDTPMDEPTARRS